MQFITCPHCDQALRIVYQIRLHPVELVESLPCPHCEESLPNPGPPHDAPPGAFVTCQLIAEPGRYAWLSGPYRLAVKAWLVVAKATSPEWPLCLLLLGLLGVLALWGMMPSERAAAAAFFALPWLAVIVAGVQKIRNRLSQNARGWTRTAYEVAGLLAVL